jgi:hypothetical protein
VEIQALIAACTVGLLTLGGIAVYWLHVRLQEVSGDAAWLKRYLPGWSDSLKDLVATVEEAQLTQSGLLKELGYTVCIARSPDGERTVSFVRAPAPCVPSSPSSWLRLQALQGGSVLSGAAGMDPDSTDAKPLAEKSSTGQP